MPCIFFVRISVLFPPSCILMVSLEMTIANIIVGNICYVVFAFSFMNFRKFSETYLLRDRRKAFVHIVDGACHSLWNCTASPVCHLSCLFACVCHPSLSIKCLLTIAKDCGRVDRTITDFSFFFGKSLTSFEFIALTWPGDTDYEFSENFQE